MLQTISWTGTAARLLDQTKLPTETVYVDITDEKQMWDAIKRLVVRGARRSAWRRRLGFTWACGTFEGNHDEVAAIAWTRSAIIWRPAGRRR